MSSIDFDACYHSPLTRAAHTAKIIWEWDGSQIDDDEEKGEQQNSSSGGGVCGKRDQDKLIEIDELREAHLYDIQVRCRQLLLWRSSSMFV